MKSIGGVGDWNTLRKVAVDGYQDGVLCLAAIETVERLNRDAVIGPLNRANAGMAAQLLADSAFFRVHLMVVRAFAPVKQSGDLHLRAAVNFLRAHLDEEPLATRRVHLTEAVRLFDAAATDQRLSSLKHMRDKMLAHWAEPLNIPLPRYDDLFGFTHATAHIWEQLSFGAGTVMIDIAHQVDAYRESADAFWGRWETSSPEAALKA